MVHRVVQQFSAGALNRISQRAPQRATTQVLNTQVLRIKLRTTEKCVHMFLRFTFSGTDLCGSCGVFVCSAHAPYESQFELERKDIFKKEGKGVTLGV